MLEFQFFILFLNKYSNHRLESSERDAEDLRKQAFFREIVLDDLLQRK